MLSLREPEWEPLLNFAPDHVGDFMWMYALQLTDGTRLQAYKHYWTRNYLHLDDEGRAFVYVGQERYEEVNPPWLLHRVLEEELEERDAPLEVTLGGMVITEEPRTLAREALERYLES